MRIISYNVNGIRAAVKKGFTDWLKTNPADVICLQETKATQDDIDVKQFEALGFHHHWSRCWRSPHFVGHGLLHVT